MHDIDSAEEDLPTAGIKMLNVEFQKQSAGGGNFSPLFAISISFSYTFYIFVIIFFLFHFLAVKKTDSQKLYLARGRPVSASAGW